VEKQFCNLLEGTLTNQIAVGQLIRTVKLIHVPVVPFYDVSFHGSVSIVRKISFCWWWVHVSQHAQFLSVLKK